MTMTIKSKWLKTAIYAFVGAFIGVFIILCIAVSAKNKTIKTLKEQVRYECSLNDSLQGKIERLGAVDCITINTICQITNKGLVNVSQTNQISKTVATYTKDEVLAAMDSLNNLRESK